MVRGPASFNLLADDCAEHIDAAVDYRNTAPGTVAIIERCAASITPPVRRSTAFRR
jgi:hypothetical protein